MCYSKDPKQLRFQASEVASIIQANIPNATYCSLTTLNLIKYSLPFEERSKFTALFSALEKLKDIQVFYFENGMINVRSH